MSSNHLEPLLQVLDSAIKLATDTFSRAAVDRTSDGAALRFAVLSLLGWGITQGGCVTASLRTKTPQGIAPNVRSLLESLITARYLTDPNTTEKEGDDRLYRYFRGVRRAQVKLRDALNGFPILKKVYLTDPELADKEKTEYTQLEKSLPPDRRLKNKHWSGAAEGLKAMADTVGMGSDYAVQYRVHSGSAHGNRPWDQAIFDADKMIVVPALDKLRDTGVLLGFDAFRYLTWLLAVGSESGAVALYDSEQEELASYRKYLEPMDALHQKGIVGPGPSDSEKGAG